MLFLQLYFNLFTDYFEIKMIISSKFILLQENSSGDTLKHVYKNLKKNFIISLLTMAIIIRQ